MDYLCRTKLSWKSATGILCELFQKPPYFWHKAKTVICPPTCCVGGDMAILICHQKYGGFCKDPFV